MKIKNNFPVALLRRTIEFSNGGKLLKGSQVFVVQDGKTCFVRVNRNDTVEYPVSKSALKPLQIFKVVFNDYVNDENGNISIDCYKTKNNHDEEGVVVAEVTPDGEIVFGTNPANLQVNLGCSLVATAIKDALNRQSEFKQDLIDKVIESVKEDLCADPTKGDVTVLDEILKSVPCKILMQSLDETEWNNYPAEFSKNEQIKRVKAKK